jgi:hypothetical protein
MLLKALRLARVSPLRVRSSMIPENKSGNDDTRRAAKNAASEPKGQELVYAVRVSLDHQQMQVDDRLANLSPGMAVTVQIETGTRRIISYLTSGSFMPAKTLKSKSPPSHRQGPLVRQPPQVMRP